jgi:uncharacterized membrane protein
MESGTIARMRNLLVFFHLAAAIFWMGGMAFMVLALRPSLGALEPPQRLALLQRVLARFFVVVGLSILVLLGTGGALFAGSGGHAPPGWNVMAGLGVLMMLVFGHILAAPWRRLRGAVSGADWAEAGRRANQIALLVKVNLGLGWLAIAAVLLWR